MLLTIFRLETQFKFSAAGRGPRCCLRCKYAALFVLLVTSRCVTAVFCCPPPHAAALTLLAVLSVFSAPRCLHVGRRRGVGRPSGGRRSVAPLAQDRSAQQGRWRHPGDGLSRILSSCSLLEVTSVLARLHKTSYVNLSRSSETQVPRGK